MKTPRKSLEELVNTANRLTNERREKWIQETVRPHVSPFFMEFVARGRALHLAARYLAIKGFLIRVCVDGTCELLKNGEVVGSLPPMRILSESAVLKAPNFPILNSGGYPYP